MMRSLYSGVSGLKNHQTRMDVVGNNISNVNTTGFKSSRVTFADTLSQTLSGASSAQGGKGGTNPKQIGLGSAVSAIDMMFTDGSVQSTGVNTDLCLSGNGLFVVANTTTDPTKVNDIKSVSLGSKYYTRNGSFRFDANGYLVNSDGLYVVGWCANKAGETYDTNEIPQSVIKVQAGEPMNASATTEAKFMNNLNAAEPTIKGITATDDKGNKIIVADGSTNTWSCGGAYKAEPILAMTVAFKNGITLGAADGSYVMGKNYGLANPLNAVMSNGDTIVIPNTSTSTYTCGDTVSNLNVSSINGTTVNFADGAVLTNGSGTSSTVKLMNGDTIEVPSTSSVAFSSAAALPTLYVSAVSGNTVTLTTVAPPGTGGETFTLTNNSGTDYNALLSSSPAVAVSNTVQSIKYNSTATIGTISGKIVSEDATEDSFVMTSGKISPVTGVDVSSLTLADRDGNIVEVGSSDSTVYKKGQNYESNVKSVTLTMSDGAVSTETTGGYVQGNSKPVSTIVTVYDDSLGNAYDVVVYLTKTKISSDGNEWTASVNTDGSGTQSVKTSDGSVVTVTMDDVVIKFDNNGGYKTSGNGPATLHVNNGAKAQQDINMNFTGLSQFAGSNTAFASADGNAFGTLKSVSIDSNGVITGTYTNGLNVARGQIAVAQFANASGLTKEGNSLYTKSNNSGEPQYGTVSGRGCTITPSALEMSNVDMASELTDMIVTQRGYQSNSKIITVSDELLETLINMKR